jgi:hypothetical protein
VVRGIRARRRSTSSGSPTRTIPTMPTATSHAGTHVRVSASRATTAPAPISRLRRFPRGGGTRRVRHRHRTSTPTSPAPATAPPAAPYTSPGGAIGSISAPMAMPSPSRTAAPRRPTTGATRASSGTSRHTPAAVSPTPPSTRAAQGGTTSSVAGTDAPSRPTMAGGTVPTTATTGSSTRTNEAGPSGAPGPRSVRMPRSALLGRLTDSGSRRPRRGRGSSLRGSSPPCRRRGGRDAAVVTVALPFLRGSPSSERGGGDGEVGSPGAKCACATETRPRRDTAGGSAPRHGRIARQRAGVIQPLPVSPSGRQFSPRKSLTRRWRRRQPSSTRRERRRVRAG